MGESEKAVAEEFGTVSRHTVSWAKKSLKESGAEAIRLMRVQRQNPRIKGSEALKRKIYDQFQA